jgi:D-alanine-D-alanine ligase
LPTLPLPVVVKPAVGGSTIGITKVTEAEALPAALEAAATLHDLVLVESFIAGEEITVAVIDGEALPVVRIVPDSGFFDYAAKYTKGLTRYEVPAAIPAASAIAAQRAAVAAVAAVDGSGLCRVDFIVPADGDPVMLEVNTLPGMTPTSLSPMAAGAVGVSFGELVERILLGAHVMAAEASG